MNDLVKIENETVLQAFTKEDGLKQVIAEATKVVNDFEHDLSTVTSRKRTATLAAKVSRLKTRMDDLGKDLVSDWKNKAKAVDVNRKAMRDELDALRDKARKPLTDWDNQEKEREANHESAVAYLHIDNHYSDGLDSNQLKAAMKTIEEITIDEGYEEYEAKAHRMKAETLKALDEKYVKQLQHEKQQAELEKLRKEKIEKEAKEKAEREERERKEKEEKIKKAAEEKARQEAEEARQKVIREAAEEKIRLELELEQAQKAKEDLEKQKKEAKRLAEQKAIESEKRAKEAAEQARLAEIARVEEKARVEKAEQEKREANKRHVQKKLKETKESLMKLGLDEATAKKVTLGIRAGEVMNVQINI